MYYCFCVVVNRQLPPLLECFDFLLEFLYDHDEKGNMSKFPKLNSSGPVLQSPVVHKSYVSFRDVMTFAINNSKGFGYA